MQWTINEIKYQLFFNWYTAFTSYVLCLLISVEVSQKALGIYVKNTYWFVYLYTWKKHQLLCSFIRHICCLNQYIKLQVIWKNTPVFSFLFLATWIKQRVYFQLGQYFYWLINTYVLLLNISLYSVWEGHR